MHFPPPPKNQQKYTENEVKVNLRQDEQEIFKLRLAHSLSDSLCYNVKILEDIVYNQLIILKIQFKN